jgi:hypothetical protein
MERALPLYLLSAGQRLRGRTFFSALLNLIAGMTT